MANSKSSLKKLDLVRESVKTLRVRTGIQTGEELKVVAPVGRALQLSTFPDKDPNSYAMSNAAGG